MRLFFPLRTFLGASSLAELAGAERVARVAICLVQLYLDVVGIEYINLYSPEGLLHA